MKQQPIMILPAFLLQLVFSACGPRKVDCPGAENNYINLTADELSKVSYTGTDTLYFLDQNNDTHIVAGQGRQYYYDSEPIFFHPECPNDRFNWYQAYKVNYVPIQGTLSFGFIQQRKGTSILIDPPFYPIHFVSGYRNLNIKDESDPYYHDSLMINGQMHYKAWHIHAYIKPTNYSIDTTYQLYYNTYSGILLMKHQDERYSVIHH